MDEQCIICGKEVPDYEPEMCCSGNECGCLGVPIEPCLCSVRCGNALFDNMGKTMDERREVMGIKWIGGE